MNTEEALARYAGMHDEWAALLILLTAEELDPEAIDACHVRLAGLATGLDAVAFAPADAPRLRDAALEADRLARAAAAAATERRDALTADQAQAQRSQGAIDAYRADGSGGGPARYVDRRT